MGREDPTKTSGDIRTRMTMEMINFPLALPSITELDADLDRSLPVHFFLVLLGGVFLTGLAALDFAGLPALVFAGPVTFFILAAFSATVGLGVVALFFAGEADAALVAVFFEAAAVGVTPLPFLSIVGSGVALRLLDLNRVFTGLRASATYSPVELSPSPLWGLYILIPSSSFFAGETVFLFAGDAVAALAAAVDFLPPAGVVALLFLPVGSGVALALVGLSRVSAGLRVSATYLAL